MEKIKEAQKVLIGIGKEWALRDDEKDIRFCHLTDPSQADLKAAYEALYDLIKEDRGSLRKYPLETVF